MCCEPFFKNFFFFSLFFWIFSVMRTCFQIKSQNKFFCSLFLSLHIILFFFYRLRQFVSDWKFLMMLVCSCACVRKAHLCICICVCVPCMSLNVRVRACMSVSMYFLWLLIMLNCQNTFKPHIKSYERLKESLEPCLHHDRKKNNKLKNCKLIFII